MIEITKDNVLPYLKAAVDTQGEDFVYNVNGSYVCRYLPIDAEDRQSAIFQLDHPDMIDPRLKTGCLIGVLLKLVGVSSEALGEGRNSSVYSLMTELADQNIVTIDEDALHALAAAQAVQDEGQTWGAAFAAAKETLPS